MLASNSRLFNVIKWIAVLLLFSCIFIPRISIGSLAGAYSIDFRAEDGFLVLIVLLIFLGTKGRVDYGKVETAYIFFLIVCILSIFNGMVWRTVDKPLLSFLYVVKQLEYLLIFVVVTKIIVNPKELRFFLKIFFLLGIVIACFGYWEHFFPTAKAIYPNYYRIFERAPFHGDANHIGGFLVLWIGFFTGVFLVTKDKTMRNILLISLLFVFFPLIWTYSRKSYFALAGVLAFLFFSRSSKRRWVTLVSLYIILSLLLPTRLSERLMDLGEAFSSQDPFHSSWAGNWVMWKQALWNFNHFFLLGSGLGSRHRLFYESQYMLVLAETGIIGFGAFIWLILSPVRAIIERFKSIFQLDGQGICLGYLAGALGVIIHSVSCVSLTVSKISIPFWFLTAVVMAYLEQTRTSSDDIKIFN